MAETGKWSGWTKSAYIGFGDDGEPKYAPRRYYRCSKCHNGTVVQTPYCPQCGAKMEKEN